ncbi:MAG: hypothetical protein H6899_11480 [Rhodobacter sp.]|nr:hypothetical protein [Paracoccaceae bacterium]MCC0080549.1 hypothetical protein [Rhodobacter sp.]
MLTQFTLLDDLRATCPDFAPQIDAFVALYGPRPDLPLYLLMGDLVVTCSQRLAAGHEDGVQRLFDQIERWIATGDRYVHDLAIAGFLEDAQNANLHRGTAPADFLRFLGPRSARSWQHVQAFWTRGMPIPRE